MEKVKKWFRDLSSEEKVALAEQFMKYHPALSEPCDFGYQYNEETKSLMFFPKNREAFLHVEKVFLFAQYYNASMYADVYDGKAVIVLF